MYVVENGAATKKTFPILGEKGSDLYLDSALKPGTLIVTEGQFVLSNGEHVNAKQATYATAQGPSASDVKEAGR
jgi:hypothetical protein